jgi:signal transduction histidine kinase/ActR/RegA family two-component response regulator
VEILGLCFDPSAEGAPFTHDRSLVLLSFVVAAAASYAALDLAERLRSGDPDMRRKWLAASAVTLGGGIWSMHFIAMLAFETPLERGYDIGLTVLSAVVAIVVVAAGLWIVRSKVTVTRLATAGTLVGVGVVAMHYTGMEALRVAGEVYYHPGLFVLSITIALGAATTALWLAATLTRWWERIGAALVMAVAICGMHYTGMAATAIVAGPDLTAGALLLSEPVLAASIAYGMLAIVPIGLVGAHLDRRMRERDVAESERLRALNASLEQRVAQRTAQLTLTTQNLDGALREAESANAAKSDFLANMSHELRTPLNAILGFAQLLTRGKSSQALSSEQLGMVDQIDRAGHHLLELINEILDLSRIEAGHLSLSIEPINAGDVVGEVVASFQPLAMDASVTIHVHVPEGYVGVMADRTRLRQILTNLVANAVKYNRRGGDVDIDVNLRRGQRDVVFAVRDTGAGIPARHLEELFEPFNRLGQETSTVVGAGVGLALCRRLVEAQGGKIWAQSVEGQGSTFTFVLPMAATPALEAAKAVQESGGRCVLLYVEDNPSNVLLMRHIINEIDGLELVVATTAVDGVSLARSINPDVIVLDINLPEMDGFEVLRILKTDFATDEIPVLALSANAMPREVARGQGAEFFRYLTKPLDIDELIVALSDVFETLPTPEVRRRVMRSLSEHMRSWSHAAS